MPLPPLWDNFRIWLTGAYRQYGQTLQQAKAEPNPTRRATLEGEAAALNELCDTLEDCLYSSRNVKRLRLSIYGQMKLYQHYADELRSLPDEAEADDLQMAKDIGYGTICRQVLQEWAEVLGRVRGRAFLNECATTCYPTDGLGRGNRITHRATALSGAA